MSLALIATPAGDVGAADDDPGPFSLPSVQREDCPPAGAAIAVFSRQAVEGGRTFEAIEYDRFREELLIMGIAYADDRMVRESHAICRSFAALMKQHGHDIRIGNIIVDLETKLAGTQRGGQPEGSIAKARLDLELAIIRVLKAAICK